jgi:hypothetical protein
MMPTRLPGRLRTSIQITLAAVTAVCLATAPGARAAPISYMFTPASGATATYVSPGTGTVTLTGTFTFDPSVPSLDAVDITATGPTTILTASPEVFDTVPAPAPSDSSFFAMSSATDDALFIGFTAALGGTPDPLLSLYIVTFTTDCTTTGPGCESVSVTGDATPTMTTPPGVPEPGSLALLGAALGLFLLTPGVIRRYRQTRPD